MIASQGRAWSWRLLWPLIAVCALAAAIVLLPVPFAVLLVLAGIVLVATLAQPLLGLLLVIVAVPFGTLIPLPVSLAGAGLTDLLVGLVVTAWLMRMIARREVRLWFPPTTWPLLLFLGVSLLSLLGALSLSAGLKEIVKWVEVLGLLVFAANVLDQRWMKVLALVLTGTGAVAALQGIYQFVFRVGPESFVLFGRFMRAYGAFQQPNPYAGYLGLTLPVAFGLAAEGIWAQRDRRASASLGSELRDRRPLARWLWTAWMLTCSALMLVALLMSWSRGAWIGLAAAVLALFVAAIVRRGRVALLVAAALLLVAYTLFVGGIVRIPSVLTLRASDTVSYVQIQDVRGAEVTDANYAVLERMAHWHAALGMWTDHPWLGVGIGNYEVAYPRYALPMWPEALGHAHNYYLNIGAEAGLLGLLAYLALWVVSLSQAWKATRAASGWQWGLAVGVLGVLVYLSVHSLFDNLYVHGMYLQLAILLGIVSALLKRCTALGSRESGRD